VSALIVLLMQLAALALGVHECFFDDKIDRSIGTMRLNYYPAQTVLPRPGQLRASAHMDYGGFTILSGEDVPGGLQVMSRQGQWIDVPTVLTNFDHTAPLGPTASGAQGKDAPAHQSS
jgi:isopenicillin N synthase-like dioxygenase